MDADPVPFMNEAVGISPPVQADPTAAPKVVITTSTTASAPHTGIPVPHTTAPNAYGMIGFPPPNVVVPNPLNPVAQGPMVYYSAAEAEAAAAAAAPPPPQAYQCGPAPTNCVKVTPVSATLNAGGTIVFATPTTPMRVVYPPQQTPIIRPTPRYGVPAPGAKIVPPRQNGPLPTFGLRPVSSAGASSPAAQDEASMSGDKKVSPQHNVRSGVSNTDSVEKIRPVPRYGVPLPGAMIVPPRQCGPPPVFRGKVFRRVSGAATVKSDAKVNCQDSSPNTSIWNTSNRAAPTELDSDVSPGASSPPSSVWDISSPDTPPPSSNIDILNELHIGPMAAQPALPVTANIITNPFVIPSKKPRTTQGSCVNSFLKQMLRAKDAMPSQSLVETARPYIPYLSVRMIKGAKREGRVIMPTADVMSVHKQLKNPYLTCNKMKRIGEKFGTPLNVRVVYVRLVPVPQAFTPPGYPAMYVPTYSWGVPPSQGAQIPTAYRSYTAMCTESTSSHDGSSQATKTSTKQTTLTAEIVSTPTGVTRTLQKITTTQEVSSNGTDVETTVDVISETVMLRRRVITPPLIALDDSLSDESSSQSGPLAICQNVGSLVSQADVDQAEEIAPPVLNVVSSGFSSKDTTPDLNEGSAAYGLWGVGTLEDRKPPPTEHTPQAVPSSPSCSSPPSSVWDIRSPNTSPSNSEFQILSGLEIGPSASQSVFPLTADNVSPALQAASQGSDNKFSFWKTLAEEDRKSTAGTQVGTQTPNEASLPSSVWDTGSPDIPQPRSDIQDEKLALALVPYSAGNTTTKCAAKADRQLNNMAESGKSGAKFEAGVKDLCQFMTYCTVPHAWVASHIQERINKEYCQLQVKKEDLKDEIKHIQSANCCSEDLQEDLENQLEGIKEEVIAKDKQLDELERLLAEEEARYLELQQNRSPAREENVADPKPEPQGVHEFEADDVRDLAQETQASYHMVSEVKKIQDAMHFCEELQAKLDNQMSKIKDELTAKAEELEQLQHHFPQVEAIYLEVERNRSLARDELTANAEELEQLEQRSAKVEANVLELQQNRSLAREENVSDLEPEPQGVHEKCEDVVNDARKNEIAHDPDPEVEPQLGDLAQDTQASDPVVSEEDNVADPDPEPQGVHDNVLQQFECEDVVNDARKNEIALEPDPEVEPQLGDLAQDTQASDPVVSEEEPQDDEYFDYQANILITFFFGRD